MIHVDYHIPFDNADFRAIKYTWKNPHTTEQALSELKQHIESIDSGARISNPFTRARGVSHLRSEEHTSELQSLMRISYAVFCLKKNITKQKLKRSLDHSLNTY